MNSTSNQVFGLLGSIVVVAAIGTIIYYGSETANVIGALQKFFVGALRVATRQ
jgi:hypothetical protein